MRYKYSLTYLADTIAAHNRESIRREIQLTAFSNMDSDEKNKQLESLRLAQSFISENPALPIDWRTSLACFKTLANYFMQQSSIEHYEEKAMCCWYLLLNQAIPQKIKTEDNKEVSNDFPYEQIIILGTTYLPEPHQFAGFIGWLLTRYVSPHMIRASTLLHQFFNYHSCDLSLIQHTYELIKNFSPFTAEFLRYTATSPCLLRGLTNSRHNGKIESYSLSGILFEHSRPFNIAENRMSEEMEFTISDKHALILLELFQFDFIKKLLSDDINEHNDTLALLLNSPLNTIIIDEFPVRALSGELNYTQTCALLTAIASTYGYSYDHIIAIGQNAFSINADGSAVFPEEDALQARLIRIITKDTFYIHVNDMFSLPNQILCNTVKKLCETQNSKSIYHLPFLVSLSKKIKHKNLIAEHEILIDFISDYLLELGNSLNDEYDSILETIKYDFSPQFERKLADYDYNIDNAINNFLSGKTDYETIEQIASAQLSTVNFIKRLLPDLLHTIDYPHGNYRLKHRIIKKCFYLSMKNETSFDSVYQLGNLLRIMSDTIENRIRILKESFVLSKNINYQKEIIIYALKQDFEFISDFFYKGFGYDCYVFDNIVLNENGEFREWAMSTIQPPSEEILLCFMRSFEKVSIAKDHLFRSPQLTPETAFRAIELITMFHNQNPLKWSICEKYIVMLHENALSQELVRFAFLEALQQSSININFIRFLCSLKHKALFSTELLSDGILISVKLNQWELIRKLCGLSNESFNPEIIAKNNVGLLIKALKERMSYSTLPEFYLKIITEQFYTPCENQNNLFHVAAISGCYQTVCDTFYFFRKYLSAKAIAHFLHAKNELGNIPNCNLESEDAEKINNFLAQKREQYKNSTIADGGFWHYQEDRKRVRPDYIVISDREDSDTDDERERSRGRRLENDQDEIEQLFRL